jgi:probable phosphoglycerate mutase
MTKTTTAPAVHSGGTEPVAETTVALVRHGQTAWHAPNRYTGSSDIPLTAEGERQAEALAGWAERWRPTSLACSTLIRARATAAPVAARTGLAPHVDHRVRELDFGSAEGHTMAEMAARHPEAAERFQADPAAHPWPGGEDPHEAVARALAAIGDLAAADPGGRVLVVAHSTLIRLLVCAVLGVPLGDYRRRLPGLAPVAATTLRLTTGGPTGLLAYNVPTGV